MATENKKDSKNVVDEEMEAKARPSQVEGEDEDIHEEEESVLAPQDPDQELEELRESVQSSSASVPIERTTERSPRSGSSQHGRRVESAAELFEDEIVQRANRDQVRLRPYLTGKIIVEIEDKKKKYLFDWSADAVKCGATNENESDCKISITEEHLLKIAAGDLNPQLAMLSDKVKVKGQLSLAIYIFNLIAPRAYLH